jgi:hypothetical protein
VFYIQKELNHSIIEQKILNLLILSQMVLNGEFWTAHLKEINGNS